MFFVLRKRKCESDACLPFAVNASLNLSNIPICSHKLLASFAFPNTAHAQYLKIPVISPGLLQLCKGLLVSKRKIFRQGNIILANVVWLHENNCCKGVVACLYQERGITGIMFCHQTGEPITLSVGLWGVSRRHTAIQGACTTTVAHTAAKHYSL